MFRDFDSGLLYKYLHQSFRTKLKHKNILMNVSHHIAIIAAIIVAIIAVNVDSIIAAIITAIVAAIT